jgi:hydroxymethylpyrimidine pyrophosphatase-like HAD family hydrolase
MPAEIELLVTDLDGTLWHTHTDDLGAVRAAWDEAAAMVPILVATGRRLASTRRPLARLGLAPTAVVLNGAMTIDLRTQHRYHVAPFRSEDALAVLAAFRSVGLDPCLYVDGRPDDVEVLLSETPATNAGHVEQLGAGAVVADLERGAREEPVLGFSIIGAQHGVLVAAAEAIGDRAEVHLDRALEYPGLAAITVAPKGQSKWDGVLAFCAHHGLDPSRVAAVADGPNDIELLTNAAVAIVPEVAHPAARALADHTIPAATERGWVEVPRVLEKLAG